MYVKVHKGTRQIGGNLIEIGTDRTRLLFDVGTNLPPLDDLKTEDPFELEGLAFGEPAFDWVFISHHHNGRYGLLVKLLPGIPVFAGEETIRILNVIADFTNRPRPEINFGFRSCRPIQLDDMRVTPIGVEHSARDAYMFLIQAEGKNVLYTGDYRMAENILPEVSRMLGGTGTLDLLISEGTNIRPEKPERQSELHGEEWIARRTAKRMRVCRGTVEDYHCSGHAYRDTIESLIVSLQPKALLPIRCEAEDRKEFLNLHDNCLVLGDGERWEVGS